MTGIRKSKREAVIKKSLRLQEKLSNRTKKKGVANPKESGSGIDDPAANNSSEVTANLEIVPNPAGTEGTEQNSDEEENINEEVVEELVDPSNKAKMDDTEYITLLKKVKIAELAVRDGLRRFNSKTISDLDLHK